MATRPKTDVLPDGLRKQAGLKGHLIHGNIHVRTGLPVIDATEPRYVTVTEEDAAKATVNDPRNCAFSQCARRTIPGLADVEFYISKAYLIYDDRVDRYNINGSTGRALAVFDLTGKFVPGRYYISAISETERTRRASSAKGRKQQKSASTPKRTKKVTAAKVKTSDSRQRIRTPITG